MQPGPCYIPSGQTSFFYVTEHKYTHKQCVSPNSTSSISQANISKVCRKHVFMYIRVLNCNWVPHDNLYIFSFHPRSLVCRDTRKSITPA